MNVETSKEYIQRYDAVQILQIIKKIIQRTR
jgi:hypothetical protein